MKAKEFQGMTDNELDVKLKELKSELFNLRFQLATGQLNDTNVIKECRHNIARVKTLIRERELGRAAAN